MINKYNQKFNNHIYQLKEYNHVLLKIHKKIEIAMEKFISHQRFTSFFYHVLHLSKCHIFGNLTFFESKLIIHQSSYLIHWNFAVNMMIDDEIEILFQISKKRIFSIVAFVYLWMWSKWYFLSLFLSFSLLQHWQFDFVHSSSL